MSISKKPSFRAGKKLLLLSRMRSKLVRRLEDKKISTVEMNTRVTVTLPSEAAHDYPVVRDMLILGMDGARINCGHDSPARWEQFGTLILTRTIWL